MKIFAETERLILRELLPTDAPGMFELDSDAEVHRYLGNNPINSMAESEAAIAHIRQQYQENGIGRWAAIEKSTGSFVGWSGLKFVTDEVNAHRNFYDVGYRLQKRHWGKGYATESATAALQYGFNQLNLAVIYGMTTIDNAGSHNVLQKTGLSFVNTFEHVGLMHNWYIKKR